MRFRFAILLTTQIAHRSAALCAFLTVACFAPGCATITGTLIGPDIQTPTTTLEKGFDLNSYFVPGRSLTLFSDASDRPPTFSTDLNAIGHDSGGLLGGIGYGAIRGLSVSGGLFASGATLFDGMWGGAKFQILGPDGLASTPLLLSVYGRAGFCFEHESSGDKNGEFGPGGFPWAVKRSGNFQNVGASVGYEITPAIVPFIGFAKGKSKTSATLTQTAAGSDPGGTFYQSYEATMTTWGGGIQFFNDPVRLSFGYTRDRTEIGAYNALESQALFSFEYRISAQGIHPRMRGDGKSSVEVASNRK